LSEQRLNPSGRLLLINGFLEGIDSILKLNQAFERILLLGACVPHLLVNRLLIARVPQDALSRICFRIGQLAVHAGRRIPEVPSLLKFG